MLREMLFEVEKDQDENKEITRIMSYITPVALTHKKLQADTGLQTFCYQNELGSELKKAMNKLADAHEALMVLHREAEKEMKMKKK